MSRVRSRETHTFTREHLDARRLGLRGNIQPEIAIPEVISDGEEDVGFGISSVQRDLQEPGIEKGGKRCTEHPVVF